MATFNSNVCLPEGNWRFAEGKHNKTHHGHGIETFAGAKWDNVTNSWLSISVKRRIFVNGIWHMVYWIVYCCVYDIARNVCFRNHPLVQTRSSNTDCGLPKLTSGQVTNEQNHDASGCPYLGIPKERARSCPPWKGTKNHPRRQLFWGSIYQ